MSATAVMLYSCSRCGMPTKFSDRVCFRCEPPKRAHKPGPSKFERMLVAGAILAAGVVGVVAMKLLWR